jgi:hypothetical protein
MATSGCAEPPTGATATDLKGAYSVNGELYVNTFGTPEGKPITTGHQDMKPSWSKTGDMLVFFRVTKFAKEVHDWKTAICTIKTDGTGFRMLTDGNHTDFNPTWTRDGTNTIVLNRQTKATRGYVVMFTRCDAGPGDEPAKPAPSLFYRRSFAARWAPSPPRSSAATTGSPAMSSPSGMTPTWT